MNKVKEHIRNLKVEAKLKTYRITILCMTVFLVLVALISTLVIRSNVREITVVWSPAIGYIQELETLTAKYRIKQYQHLAETDASTKASCEQDIAGIADQITEYAKKLDAIINSEKEAQKGKSDYEKASTAWNDYKAASEEILQLSNTV